MRRRLGRSELTCYQTSRGLAVAEQHGGCGIVKSRGLCHRSSDLCGPCCWLSDPMFVKLTRCVRADSGSCASLTAFSSAWRWVYKTSSNWISLKRVRGPSVLTSRWPLGFFLLLERQRRESSLLSRFLIARISAHILSHFHILAFALNIRIIKQ